MERPPIQDPASVITTSSAIIAVKYDGGILIASDQSCSYGTSCHYMGVSHFHQLTPGIIIGGTGELADFQAIINVVSRQIEREETRSAGGFLSPAEVHNYIKRYQYMRRTKVDPWLITVVVAGVSPDGGLFLAVTDPWGTSWEERIITTGIAKHIKGQQLDAVVGGPKDAVFKAMNEVWQGIYSRYSLTRGPLEYFDVTATGITRLPDVKIAVNWSNLGALYGAGSVA
jgi:20S proteasome subunit beta 7